MRDNPTLQDNYITTRQLLPDQITLISRLWSDLWSTKILAARERRKQCRRSHLVSFQPLSNFEQPHLLPKIFLLPFHIGMQKLHTQDQFPELSEFFSLQWLCHEVTCHHICREIINFEVPEVKALICGKISNVYSTRALSAKWSALLFKQHRTLLVLKQDILIQFYILFGKKPFYPNYFQQEIVSHYQFKRCRRPSIQLFVLPEAMPLLFLCINITPP